MPFGSGILDVVIGVIFGFLAVSLLASAVVEAAYSILKLRATNLKEGVARLVNDPDFTGLAKLLYEHGYISPLGPGSPNLLASNGDAATVATPIESGNASGKASVGKTAYDQRTNLPSYIDKSQFAAAFLDVLKLTDQHLENLKGNLSGPAAIEKFHDKIDHLDTIPGLGGQIDKIQFQQIKQLLKGIVSRSNGEIQKIEADVGNWFDGAMDRVGGAFKRRTQLYTFLAALFLAALINVDTIRIGTALWEHPAIVDNLKFDKATDSLKSVALMGKEKEEAKKPQGGADNEGPMADGAPPLTKEDATYIVAAMMEAGLPLGWAPQHVFEVSDSHGHWVSLVNPDDPPQRWMIWRSLMGWLITAMAAMFGAPFWFDTLQKIVRLKGAGPSPAEKKDKDAAAA